MFEQTNIGFWIERPLTDTANGAERKYECCGKIDCVQKGQGSALSFKFPVLRNNFLPQQLENRRRLLVSLGQHGLSSLLDDVPTSELRGRLRVIRILDPAARFLRLG